MKIIDSEVKAIFQSSSVRNRLFRSARNDYFLQLGIIIFLARNPHGVADLRGTRQRAKVRGQVRFDSRLYQQVVGTSRLRGSCWHAAPVSESTGFRGLALERRASDTSAADWYLVSVTEQMIGTLDEASWDPQGTQLISLSHWKSAQQALLLARRDAWLRGSAGTAVFTPNSAAGDWVIRTW